MWISLGWHRAVRSGASSGVAMLEIMVRQLFIVLSLELALDLHVDLSFDAV